MSAPFRTQADFAIVTITALIAFALVLVARQVFNDGDTYWHVAAGQWMLDNRAMPRVDPFSFTFAGQPWTAHEWLSEILMALAYRMAGWSGVAILFACAAGGVVLALGWRLAKSLSGTALLGVLVVAIACVGPSLLARPHLLALPVMTLWVSGLMAAREEDRPPAWALLALMVLWANLHGSFVLGLALIAPFALEALLAAPAQDRIDVIKRWGVFGFAALAAAAITPHGIEGLIFPLKLMALDGLDHVIEWAPTDFSKFQPMEIALIGGLFVLLYKGVKIPVIRLVLMLALLHMALQHQRHQMIFAIVAAMIVAPALAATLAPRAQSTANLKTPAAIFAALALALLLARAAIPLPRGNDSVTPASALARVPAELRARPVFNEYGFGGYLIFAGVRPFIDGRTDMYGDAFMARYDSITRPDAKTLEQTFARYGVEWTILAAGNPAISVLDAQPGWKRLYADEFAVVHVRAR